MSSPTPSIMLSALAGATWIKQFALATQLAGGGQSPLGAAGWGVELSIVDYSRPTTPATVATATVANNKIAWVAPGVLWVSFPQIETRLWTWRRASWYLDLIKPSTLYDPAGTRQTLLRGFIVCDQRAPVNQFIASTQNSL